MTTTEAKGPRYICATCGFQAKDMHEATLHIKARPDHLFQSALHRRVRPKTDGKSNVR